MKNLIKSYTCVQTVNCQDRLVQKNQPAYIYMKGELVRQFKLISYLLHVRFLKRWSGYL